MSWDGSTRRQRLPANWSTPGGLRDQVLGAPRGRVCKLRYDGCTKFATQVDHKKPGDDHRLGAFDPKTGEWDGNLQSACKHCHLIKSSREGNAARPREKRPPEVHPAYRR